MGWWRRMRTAAGGKEQARLGTGRRETCPVDGFQVMNARGHQTSLSLRIFSCKTG